MKTYKLLKSYQTPGHPIAFSGPKRSHSFFKDKMSFSKVKNALEGVDAYTLHRQFKKSKIRNPFFVLRKRSQFQADLIDISKLAKHNDGVRYLLVVIDSFTKKATAKPLQKKTSHETTTAMKECLAELTPNPETIVFDRGTEFTNKLLKQELQDRNIEIIHPEGEHHAAIAERFNRSLQDLIYKLLTNTQSLRYIDTLPLLLHTYNNRSHRTLQGLSPNQAELDKNQHLVRMAMQQHFNKARNKKKRAKHNVGQSVRIALFPSKFKRGYDKQFSNEIFTITNVNERMPIPMYTLSDHREKITGNFYANELQPVMK